MSCKAFRSDSCCAFFICALIRLFSSIASSRAASCLRACSSLAVLKLIFFLKNSEDDVKVDGLVEKYVNNLSALMPAGASSPFTSTAALKLQGVDVRRFKKSRNEARMKLFWPPIQKCSITLHLSWPVKPTNQALTFSSVSSVKIY